MHDLDYFSNVDARPKGYFFCPAHVALAHDISYVAGLCNICNESIDFFEYVDRW